MKLKIVLGLLFLASCLVLRSPLTHARAAGSWQNITPPGLNSAESVATDPAHPGTVYVGTSYQGIYKTLDSGAHWSQINPTGPCGTPLFDGRVFALAVDETGAVYANNGYGCAQGIFKSVNGGATWTSLLPSSLPTPDVGHIELDPYLPGHILATLHSDHTTCQDNCDVHPYESFDHGATWALLPIVPGTGWQQWGHFLGNSDSWIIQSTYNGVFKTTNHGQTYTQVSTTPGTAFTMVRLGGTYYLPSASGVLKSADNGASWSVSMCGCSPYPTLAVGLLDSTLHSRIAQGQQSGPMRMSTDGITWTNEAQNFTEGPAYMASDAQYLYTANYQAGVWRLMSSGPPPTPTNTPIPPTPTVTPIPPTPTPTPVPHTYQCLVDGVVVWTQQTPGRTCP